MKKGLIVVHTETEDGVAYECHYKTKDGCSVLIKVHEMDKEGGVKQISISLVENPPATDKSGLAGYARLGKSKSFVPHYLALNRSHLKKARLNRAKYFKKSG